MPPKTRSPRTGTRSAVRKSIPTAQQSVIDARSNQAWRAVRQFTAMLPTFTSFARMATGNNKVTVRLGKQGAQTDGSSIWIFPPISLGEERIHDRSKCDRRGYDKRQMCKACDAREVSLFYLFHEIAHIAFDSVVRPLDYLVDKVEAMIDDWHPAGVCSHAGYMKRQAQIAENYMALGGAHNGFLPTIVNALEDARVNARMFRTRPGLKIMFEAGTVRVFEKGIELSTGEVILWRDQKPNPAAIIGLFLLSSGYRVEEGYFSEQVSELLLDATLVKLCDRVVRANSAHQIMEISIDTFKRLNELGFCNVPKCEASPPIPAPSTDPDDEEQDANEPTDGDPDSGGSSSPSGDADEGDQSDDSGSVPPDNGDTGSGVDGEDQQPDSTTQDAGPTGPDSDDSEYNEDSGDGDSKDGTGNGAGDSRTTEDPEGTEDPASADGDVRGSDDDDDSSEGEDDLGGSSESTEDVAHSDEGSAGSGSSGASGNDNGDDQSDSELASPSSADAESDDGDSTSESEDDDEGESSSKSASDANNKNEDQTPSVDDENAVEPVEPDVSESVWDDPAAATAAARQYERNEQPALADYGSPSEVADLVKTFGAHEDVDDFDVDDSGISHTHFGDEEHEHEDQYERQTRELQERTALERAVKQSAAFDTQSHNLGGLKVFDYPMRSVRWADTSPRFSPDDFKASEGIMGPAVMRARLVFEDNVRSRKERNLKSGRVDAKVLGKRAPFGDERIMSKKRRPGKKSRFYAIGVDISGSTSWYERNARIKRAVMAQAELLHRVGVTFAIYGMTGGQHVEDLRKREWGVQDDIWVMKVKGPEDPWNVTTQQKLADLDPVAENYDGHNIEFLRKICDTRSETDRGIIYYTDGEMPAANADEELVVLNDELRICRMRKYGLLAVGINTDSPRQYGLDTVQVDSDADITKVVEQLGRHLIHS